MFTYYQFIAEFPNDKACLKYMMKLRYKDTSFKCPKCDQYGKFSMITKRRAYACQWCGHHIYPSVGTIFEGSRTPLHKWFYAIYLFSTTKHGIAAKELQRQLGVTYKTAWRMAHKIRELMAQIDGDDFLEGTVEVDETYVGGKTYRGRRSGKKTVLLGMAERGGRVRTKRVPDVKAHTLLPLIVTNIDLGSFIYSDEHVSYARLYRWYDHLRVCHKARQYVDGDVHTNSIEGFWSRIKLSIRGTHVWVSGKHLQKYADEFAYRYNRRQHPERIFDELVDAAVGYQV